MKNWRIIAILLLVLVLTGATACEALGGGEEVTVQEVEVVRGDLIVSVSGSGSIDISDEADLTFGLGGNIDRIYVDEDDVSRLAALKRDYADAVNKGELMILPGTTKDAGFQELTLPPVEAFLAWIRYLENFIYIAVGIPKVIMGSVDSIPESGGKISYLTYEQIYSRETREMEADLWNQLAIRITFNSPASIAEGVSDEKSTAQTGFQPQDTKVGGAE